MIGMEVIIQTDFLMVLGIMWCSMILDVTMLRWITYVKSLNSEVRHISGKDNVVADMLSRARFGDEVAESEEEEVLEDYFSSEHVHRFCAIREFREKEYGGETLRIERML